MAGWLAASAHCAAGGQERQGRDGPGREMGGTGGQGQLDQAESIGPVGPGHRRQFPSSWTFPPHIPQVTVHDDGFGPEAGCGTGERRLWDSLGGRQAGTGRGAAQG